MHLNISVENYDSPQQIRSLANALIAFSTELETNGRTSGEVGTASVTIAEPIDFGGAGSAAETPEKPKRTRKPAAAAAAPEVEPEPEPDPDLPPDEDEEEPAAPKEAKKNGKAAGDDKALRQEVLERFASYADEAGVLEGKSLLGEFNASKFSEVAGTDLRAFAKRLTVLEASL
jgi:hypothetical protein